MHISLSLSIYIYIKADASAAGPHLMAAGLALEDFGMAGGIAEMITDRIIDAS